MNPRSSRPALIGAVVGVLCVLALGGAVLLGESSARPDAELAAGGPVLVALVLPDADGVLTVRALESMSRSGSTISLSSVDPLTSATVPGTSATTLAEGYAYGGGRGLAAAYAGGTSSEKQAWIVVSPAAWVGLMGDTPVKIPLAQPIEVFDGTRLYSFAAGEAAVPPAQVGQLMNGAVYSGATERRRIREGLGMALATALLRSDASAQAGVDTNLSPEQLNEVFGSVKSVPVRADTTR